MAIITINKTLEMIEFTCKECQGVFSLDSRWVDEARRQGQFQMKFACPYCHCLRGWGQNEEHRLKLELEASRKAQITISARVDQERQARVDAERAAISAKGQITKLKKRIGNGVCPCCNRFIKQLARHMETCHPAYHESKDVK